MKREAVVAPGDDVHLEQERRHPEGVDDVGRAELDLDGLVDRQHQRGPVGRRADLVDRRGAVERLVLDVVEGPRPLLADDRDRVVGLAGRSTVVEDIVLGGDRVEEEDQHHHDRRDRVEDLDRQVVARLHGDLVVAAAAVARTHGVADQTPDEDADDDRREPRPLPQVVDRGSPVGDRLGHGEALDLVLVSASRRLSKSKAGGPGRSTGRSCASAGGVADPRTSLSLTTISHDDGQPEHYYWAWRPGCTGRGRLGVADGPGTSRGRWSAVVLACDASDGLLRRTSAGYLDSASTEPLHPAARETLLAALDQGYADPARLHGPRPDRAAAARQRARGRLAALLGVAARRGDASPPSGTAAVHLGAPRAAAGPPPGRRAGWCTPPSSTPRSSRPAAGGTTYTGGTSDVVAVDAQGRVPPRRSRGRARPSRGRGRRRPVRQPGGRHACSRSTRWRSWPRARRAAVRGRRRGRRTAGPPGRLGGGRGLGAQVGRAGRRRGAAGAQGRALAGAVPRPTTGSTRGWPASRTSRPPSPRRPRSQAVVAERDEVAARQRALVDRLRARVPRLVADVDVVGDPDDRLPHVVTFSCLYVEGEALVRELDRHGFARRRPARRARPSTLTPSHVLAAMGALTHGNVRVSLGPRHHRGRRRRCSTCSSDVLPRSRLEGLRR